jgi:hypothetical protein
MTKLSIDIQATSVADVLLGQRCTHGAARPPRRPCHRRERGSDPEVHCRAVTKRAWASLLCGSALFPVLLAAIIPLAGNRLRSWWPSDQPCLMTLVLAAGCVGFHRFFGFSSAWMRFIATELRISQVLRALDLDWESRRTRLRRSPHSRPAGSVSSPLTSWYWMRPSAGCRSSSLLPTIGYGHSNERGR